MKARMDQIPEGAFKEQVSVRSYEIGRDGAVRPATLLRYLEHLATDASADAGFDPAWYVRQGTAWVVRNMDIFLGELPRFGDQLGMATWVAEFRHVQAIRDYAIWNVKTGALIARAEARWAYIDRDRAAPVRLPDAFTLDFKTLGHAMTKRALVPTPVDSVATSSRYDHTAREYEVDSQLHINNCAYVDWLWEATRQALATEGASLAAACQPRYHALEYIRPTLAGEQVQIATRLTRRHDAQFQVEQEMRHASTGATCFRALTTYLRPMLTPTAS